MYCEKSLVIVNNLRNISDDDRAIFKEVILKNNLRDDLISRLSFYSPLSQNIEEIDNYRYIHVVNEPVYCVTTNLVGHGLVNIFFDEEKRLIFNTRWWFHCGILGFFQHMQHLIERIFLIINLNDYTEIDEGISIGQWFFTYGHFLDEVYNLYAFRLKFPMSCNPQFLFFANEAQNYQFFTNTLFSKNFQNIATATKPLIKINKDMKIILHKYNSITFHSFPHIVTNQILEFLRIPNSIEDNKLKGIFITRGIATHMPRNLKNQKEIEDYLKKESFEIVNPEDISVPNFIKCIRKSNNIIMTWGSAMVNMIFLNPGSRVTILKSESYMHENIKLFQKIIDGASLDVRVIPSINNVIEVNQILLDT